MYTCFALPPSYTVARWMFGCQVRFVCRFEWLTAKPTIRIF